MTKYKPILRCMSRGCDPLAIIEGVGYSSFAELYAEPNPTQALVDRLGAKQNGKGWVSRCSADGHEDNNPSLHISEGTTPIESRTERSNGVNDAVVAPRDWPSLAAQYEQAIDDAKRDELAALLGVGSDALRALHVGHNGRDWTFPERSADGLIIGIVRRTQDGKKLAMKGGKRGLTLPDGWHGQPGPLLVPEGASDVAALLTVNVNSIGRPQASVGRAVEWLADALRDYTGDICIIAENDQKPDGSWPGRDGAIACAGKLARLLDRPVKWTLPPDDVKDMRALLGARDSQDDETIRAEILALVENAEVVTPEKPAPPSPQSRLAYNDVANGRRLVKLHGADLRYCGAHGWLVWDGRRFAEDQTGDVHRRTKDAAEQYVEAAINEPEDMKRAAMFAWGAQSLQASRIKNAIDMARSEPGVAVTADAFDCNPELFNIANGTINLRNGEVRQHDRADMLTKIGNVTYKSAAECPRFRAFADEVFCGDAELIAYMRRLMGYSLTAHTSEQSIHIAYGTGANGKTQLMRVWQWILGDYALSTPAETFMVHRNPTVRNDLARLAGARLVVSVEVDDGQQIAESLVKQFTGEDWVSARKLYREPFEFLPVCKIVIAANHRPFIRGTDYAIWRRIHLIPFKWTVPPEKRIPSFAERHLIPEASGILNWALTGLQEWRERGLDPPASVKAATDEYRDELDPLADWIIECCIEEPLMKANNADLYQSYVDWAKRNGVDPVSGRWFGRRLAEKGFPSSSPAPDGAGTASD